MNYCPCCSDSLLKHIRKSETYWFCRTCWQEMPIITPNLTNSLPETILGRVPRKIHKQERISSLVQCPSLSTKSCPHDNVKYLPL